MKTLGLLYSCDARRSCGSMDLIGVFSSKQALKRYLSGMNGERMGVSIRQAKVFPCS